MFLFLLSCGAAVECGPGTELVDGICLPVEGMSDGGVDGGGSDGGADGGATDGGGSDGGADGGATDGGGSDGGADGGATDGGTTDGGTTDGGTETRSTKVWLLGGQSNMVGIGQVTGLPPSLRTAQADVQIYWSGLPGWRPLEPSSGYSSGSARYTGPETSFGRALADALPGVDVMLIKHAVGGTDLAQYWYPGEARDDGSHGDGYRDWLATVDGGLAELDAAGVDYEIAGMIWMQGESDAAHGSWSAQYEDNLTHFVERVRSDTGVPELPFALGLIDCQGNCAYRETVRTAQQAVADADDQVFAIETEDLGLYLYDWWHYQGMGIRVMGERFADVLLGEAPAEVPQAAVEVTGTYTYSYYGDYMVGWRFTVAEAIEVTDVGVFDVGQDGLAHTADVAIWETDGETLLSTDTVPAWDEADTTLLDGFRTVGIEPLVLEPGDYIIANQSFDTDWDWYVFEAQIEAADGLEWVEGRHSVGSAVAFPDSVSSGAEGSASWFGAGFRFRGL